ncbi:hypothetical protein RDI58_001029 [Solanum bulbocastanum]|uniref:Uncharacterized protein n=1 Tax=Solanum bulbocastanum TaxID=147425 RepID=A0AAN8UBS7_SOLBU
MSLLGFHRCNLNRLFSSLGVGKLENYMVSESIQVSSTQYEVTKNCLSNNSLDLPKNGGERDVCFPG